MDELFDDTLSVALDKIGSNTPTPGGGAAAVLAGLIGVQLIRMATGISAATAEGDSLLCLTRGQEGLSDLSATLPSAAIEDMAVFGRYMSAIKLPKGNPEEETTRSAALDSALKQAIEAPLKAASMLASALDLAAAAEPHVKDAVVSDLFAGIVLIFGALQAVLLNVDINLKSKRANPLRDMTLEQKRRLLESAQTHYATMIDRASRRGFPIVGIAPSSS